MNTLALVGCAHIHTPGFVKKLKERQAAGSLKVKYVWDPLKDRAAVHAQELGAKTVGSAQKIWADPEVQAVVICSETNLHKKLVTAAATAKKHLFAEKPLGLGAKDSYAMADAVEAAGVLFQTGYFNRTVPINLFIKEQVGLGHFGKITRVRGSNCHSGALGGWFDEKPQDPAHSWRWMADPKIAGCGAFGDLGTHSLDLLMWLMGDVAAVAAKMDMGTARYGDCDETGEALIRFQNGTIGTLAGAWDDLDDPLSLLVSGTEGCAAVIRGQLFFTSKHVPGADGKQPWTQLPLALPQPLDLFLNAVGGEPAPLVGVREAAKRVAVMEAMYRAAAKGKWVEPA